MNDNDKQVTRWASADMHPPTEAQALYDHFNGNVPHEGGRMSKVIEYLETRSWIHQNDWKPIYEMALKIYNDHGKKLRRSTSDNDTDV